MVVRSDGGGATACPTTDTDGARGPSSAPHANSHGSSTAARTRRDREANRVAMTDVQTFVNCMCAYLRLSHAATLMPGPELPGTRGWHRASERFRGRQYHRARAADE